MSHPRLRLLGLMLLPVLLSGGCRPSDTTGFTKPEDMERYASLELAAAAHDPELRAEVARLLAEQASPAQLAGGIRLPSVSSQVRTRNAAISALLEIFPADTRELLLPKLRACFPDDGFRFAPLMRQSATGLLTAANSRRIEYERLILTKPLQPVFPHAMGMAADVSYLQAIEIGHLLTGLHVAELLDDNRVLEASESIAGMFRAVEWLASEKHTVPRIAAARLRASALAAAGAVVRHPRADRETCVQLREIVAKQVANWPADANAWIGERAEGLHTYEVVRDGYLLAVIPFEKLREIREDVGIKKLGEVIGATLDADEQFYLQAMRALIAASSQNYSQQTATARQILADMERLRNSDRYPFVAEQLLLVDVESRQRAIVVDRARCLAWLVALSLATGQEPPAGTVNPLSGEPFAVVHFGGNVLVEAIAPEIASIEIPDRSTAR